MGTLAVALVALPLLGSALVAAMSRGGRRSLAHWLALVMVSLTALCAVALLPYAGGVPAVAVQWLPGIEPMGLNLSVTGVYGLLVTAWGAFLVLFGATFRRAPCPPLSRAVTLLALAAANAAFLADHFLARYVVLEVVALCIALALVVELRDATGIRLAWSSYLLLRLGDVALLVGILMLKEAIGTLVIGPALGSTLSSLKGTGSAPDARGLAWVVATFVVAAWVKMGGWPFHLWSQPGRRLEVTSQAWLYATVMPNLGMYLLYRVTPLLASVGSLQTAALWLGGGGAALAALMALTQADSHGALVYVGATQGGLCLFVAASGVEPAVWLGLLALTPLRLLLFLAADAARGSHGAVQRRIAAGSFALGGVTWTALGLLGTWWTREAGAPLDALLIAEVAVGLSGVWAVRATQRLLAGPEEDLDPAIVSPIRWAQWVAIGVLGGGVLAGTLGFRPLASRLTGAAGMALPEIPTLPALLRYTVTAPALLAVVSSALAVWYLQRRFRAGPHMAAPAVEEAYDLEEGLAQAARALHAVVEAGILGQLVVLAVRAVVEGARVVYRVVEIGVLGQLVVLAVRAVVEGARVIYHIVEQEGLEGLLRRSVRAVLALSRGLQSGHTGRLRHNLGWVTVSLALAVLALVWYGG